MIASLAPLRLVAAALVASALSLGAAAPGGAQSLFSAAVHVNDQAITRYEIEQRARFLEFIGAGGSDPRARARERLIEERLMLQEAARFNLRVSRDQLNAAAEEFAARGDQTAAGLIAAMAAAGIERDTFDAFIRAGTVWRELVQGRIAPDIRITDADIDHAIMLEAQRPVTEVMISELFLSTDPQFSFMVRQILPAIANLTSVEAFSQAARQYSIVESAQQGGRVNRWIPLASMPESLSIPFATAAPATIVGPIEVPGAIAFFQLRERREIRNVPPGQVELDYRMAVLPGGRSDATLAQVQAIRGRTDSCADFGAAVTRTVAGIDPDSTQMQSRREPSLPAGLRGELARMNPGEISANLVQDGGLLVVMLCNRRVVPDPEPTREQMRTVVFSQALEQAAMVYLQTLRASADIR